MCILGDALGSHEGKFLGLDVCGIDMLADSKPHDGLVGEIGG